MTLSGGPFNGKEIEDIGTVTQKLSIHRPRGSDTECGYAVYEPSQDRACLELINVIEDIKRRIQEEGGA